MEKIKISENQKKCLEVLAEVYEDEADCLYFKYVAKKTGLEEKKVRVYVRALARKGLAEYVTGLADRDWETICFVFINFSKYL